MASGEPTVQTAPVQRVILAMVAIRVVAALLMVVGPWTDSPDELAGWDVERFQAIADADGRPWVDEPVEYPPGSVALIEGLDRGDVVGTHRALVLASLAVDLAVAFAVGALGGRRAAAAYLVLGLPLVPMGLLRFDLWATLPAVLAVAALQQRRGGAFALFATAGAMVKVWPGLLLVAAAAIGRWGAATAGAVLMAVAGVVWIGWAGWSLEPIEQVTSMRGAVGWHVESIPGSITALVTDDEATLQQNAYRIGGLDERLVLAGRVLTVVVAVAAAGFAIRNRRRAGTAPDLAPTVGAPGDTATVALVLTAAVGALLLTSPLLSPQFLLWLTPWVALAPPSSGGTAAGAAPRPSAAERNAGPIAVLRERGADWPTMWWPAFAATALTGVTLARFTPSGLAETTPALLLLGRDALLVLVVVLALGRLWSGPIDPGDAAPADGEVVDRADEEAVDGAQAERKMR
ncbi:MAG: hypothetical protein AAGD35_15390 [Actinomycetota bacterium]